MVERGVSTVRDPERRWSVGSTLGDPALRIPLTYFTVAQLLDVLSTVVGLFTHRLSELNPITVGILDHYGAMGLLLQKVAVVIAAAMAAALLPRRTAFVVCWGFVVVMAAVVASNVGVIWDG